MTFVNPFTQPGNWYKANLHTHSTASDGESSPTERIRQYQNNGYSILAVSDHNVITNLDEFNTPNTLLVRSMETHPAIYGEANPNLIHHLVCLNVPADLSFPDSMDANARIRIVRERGGEVIYAHPYWSGHTINHLLSLKNYLAIEVYNATATKIGRAYSSVHWDDLLSLGKQISAIAVDDTHRDRDIFMGWSWFKCPSLTLENFMTSLRTGCFYSSCGPVIHDYQMIGDTVCVKCSEVREIHFIGKSFYGKCFYADASASLTQAEAKTSSEWNYVRCEVVDQTGRRAWTNPIFV
jgi:hypothetical protein